MFTFVHRALNHHSLMFTERARLHDLVFFSILNILLTQTCSFVQGEKGERGKDHSCDRSCMFPPAGGDVALHLYKPAHAITQLCVCVCVCTSRLREKGGHSATELKPEKQRGAEAEQRGLHIYHAIKQNVLFYIACCRDSIMSAE